MTVVLEGYIKVPLQALETIKNNLDEHIQNTLNEQRFLYSKFGQNNASSRNNSARRS